MYKLTYWLRSQAFEAFDELQNPDSSILSYNKDYI